MKLGQCITPSDVDPQVWMTIDDDVPVEIFLSSTAEEAPLRTKKAVSGEWLRSAPSRSSVMVASPDAAPAGKFDELTSDTEFFHEKIASFEKAEGGSVLPALDF